MNDGGSLEIWLNTAGAAVRRTALAGCQWHTHLVVDGSRSVSGEPRARARRLIERQPERARVRFCLTTAGWMHKMHNAGLDAFGAKRCR